MYSASDLRKGLKILMDGAPYVITDFDFCKPGKGTALYRCKLKNMISGGTTDRTFRPTDSVGKPNLEEKEMVFMYEEAPFYVFQDQNYEEVRVDGEVLGDNKYFLDDNMECTILFFDDKPIDITLPYFVEKRIAETEPGAKGDTATNATKPAKIENGYNLMVPLFINEGDIVRIDTRTGEYADRVSKA